MDFYGFVQPYRINRQLLDFEREEHLTPTKRLGVVPHYNLSVIRINGTFLEGADKFYYSRGFVAMAGIPLAVLLWLVFAYDGITRPAILMFLNLAVATGCSWLVFRDTFTYTHFPIRLNRKNRQVYVWRRNGTVLKVGWDDIYFTIGGSETTWKDLYVAGHVMDADGKTVRETFALGASGEKDQLHTLWEFYRRYMEEGPQAVLSALEKPLICLPRLDLKRETWRFGWERITLQLNGLPLFQLLLQVGFFPQSLFRWVAMRTSKIPRWPKWVEDECAIAPDDPCVMDVSTNVYVD
ncbi:DUF6708 domain-containing protein [Aromatoleum toluclasticum]|uniref:DUF6708 domain-containing protein n=1 Tax=Aromatoleum toluclasticum TaxID=92003 RepID=UPI000376DE4B|nr:DUF6708 domain-containing protein [Aromatoleum toluclasticum]